MNSGNENTRHEITRIPQCALWLIFPIRNTSILIYLQHVSFLLAGVLPNEIVMLSFPTNQEEATPLKIWNVSFWTESHSVKTSMVGCISKFYFLSCSARSRILYEVEPLLHKTSDVLLPSVQKHVQIHLTLALTLFFWLWTDFCP